MSAQSIIDLYATSTGWNEDSIIDILCEYIDNQSSPEAFEDFVQRKAEEENETD